LSVLASPVASKYVVGFSYVIFINLNLRGLGLKLILRVPPIVAEGLES
jgi:hypothetical protein